MEKIVQVPSDLVLSNKPVSCEVNVFWLSLVSVQYFLFLYDFSGSLTGGGATKNVSDGNI